MKKNILYLTYSLNVGGLEKMVLDLAVRVNKGPYSVAVCAFEQEGALTAEFERNNVPALNLSKKPGLDLALVKNLLAIVKERGIDIVHTHDATPWLYGGILKMIHPQIKLVHTEHSNVPGNSSKLKILEYLLAKISNVVIADSQAVADFLVKKAKISSKSIKIIYNGIDVDRFAASKISIDPGAQPKDREPAKIGITARLAAVKDHTTLLQAFRRVLNETKEVELWIIGDGELAGELKKVSKDLNINEQVKFLGNRDDVPEILKTINIFTLSSKSEGLSLAILEAMAAALPVVATEVGGNPEIVISGTTGLLVPPANPEKLAQSILHLLNDKNLALSMGQQGRARVLDKFNINTMVQEYQQIYEGLF